MSEEIKPDKDIDIKFIRLSKPILNTLDLPLSGIYNDINNTEFSNFPLKNKVKNFGISSPEYIGLDNLFQINNSFGKLLTEEVLEGLIILTNYSNKEITILNLEIVFNIEEIKTENNKINEKKKKLPIKLPGLDNSLLLLPNQSFSFKVQNNLDFAGKYIISVNFRTKCPYYTQQYNSLKQRGRIKEKDKDFIINKDNQIEFNLSHNFTFNVNFPFNIKTIFRMNQMKEEYFIEVNIKNQSRYDLTLPDLIIMPKKRNNIQFKPVFDLQEIQNTENNPENGGFKNNSNILSLQPHEEINLLFKSNDSDIFLNEESFLLFIKWLNFFDFSPKTFQYEFKNGLSIFNEYFIFKIIERPMGNIIQNMNFPIVFQFITKQPEKAFSLVISEYTNNYNLDENKNKIIKNNGNEINIKIKEYKIEINNNFKKNNVNIICKSDKLGIVSFPQINITLYEMKNNKEDKIAEYIYKDILSFYCVQNVQLI